MTRPVLHTERLTLRPMTLEHLPLLRELDSDPEVMRFIIGRARTPAEVTDFWGPKCADTTADAAGLGWWVGFVGDEFVGWWDLSPGSIDEPTESADRAEAGWRLRRTWWRQGLASEGAEVVFAHGFETVGLETIWAETMAVNQGSRRVMERLGMRLVRTEFREYDNPLPGNDYGDVIYEITREEWLDRLASG